MKSIKYYNDNSDVFINGSKDANMNELHVIFRKYMKRNGTILDLGCGSGRDSIYFSDKGYKVISLDGSIKMIEFCKSNLNNKIVHSTFKDYEPNESFDGIWACASLLHVNRTSINLMIKKYINHLKLEGVFFISFKNRENDFIKGDRDFTCFTKSSLDLFLKELKNIEILEYIETVDVRDNREDEKWISVIIRRNG